LILANFGAPSDGGTAVIVSLMELLKVKKLPRRKVGWQLEGKSAWHHCLLTVSKPCQCVNF